MKGRAAAHTGKENGAWAGSRQGRNYTVQGNILVGPEVVDAVAGAFESTEGTGMPLAERLITALEAGPGERRRPPLGLLPVRRPARGRSHRPGPGRGHI